MRVEPIDLRPFRDGSDADRRRVAQQFDHAARTSGFLSITAHGVDSDLCAEMLGVTAQYFDPPESCRQHDLIRCPFRSERSSDMAECCKPRRSPRLPSSSFAGPAVGGDAGERDAGSEYDTGADQ
jgi:isopenicillin N synthase-like dioxygenase